MVRQAFAMATNCRANIVSDFKAFAGNRINISMRQLIAGRETSVYETVRISNETLPARKHSAHAGIFSDITP